MSSRGYETTRQSATWETSGGMDEGKDEQKYKVLAKEMKVQRMETGRRWRVREQMEGGQGEEINGERQPGEKWNNGPKGK